MPVTGPLRFFVGRSKMVVFVAGALCSGYASRNGRLDGGWPAVERFRGVGGARVRVVGRGTSCATAGTARGAVGGGPGL